MLRPVKTRAASASSLTVARRTFPLWALLQLILALALTLIAAFVLIPLGMWMYHTERGGQLVTQALKWPEPRYADDLPSLRDLEVAHKALAHLQAAVSWRPRATEPYRLMARVFAAQGDWMAANKAFDVARQQQPADPLLAWEQALIVERELEKLEQSSTESILPDLLSAPVEAPATPVNTIYCEPGQAASCYVAFERFTQAFADDPAAVPVQLDALFMYPPAAVTLKRPLYASHPVLSFALGLDPNMHQGKSDGATFEVWITGADGRRQPVYTRTIDHAEAQQGWIRDHADLSSWIGQDVILELRTTGGPVGDTIDDWYAWGDIVLTTAEAAQNNRRLVEHRLGALWESAKQNGTSFSEAADVHLRRGEYREAHGYYQRVARIAPQHDSDSLFRIAVASASTTNGSPFNSAVDGLAITAIEHEATIKAADLRWLLQSPTAQALDGDALGAHPGPDPNIGVMWWGGTALTLVDVLEGGTFCIRLAAQHVAPAPIELELLADEQTTKHSLGRADGSWEEIAFERELKPGLHVLGVRFTNDSFVGGADRNAVIGDLRVERVE